MREQALDAIVNSADDDTKHVGINRCRGDSPGQVHVLASVEGHSDRPTLVVELQESSLEVDVVRSAEEVRVESKSDVACLEPHRGCIAAVLNETNTATSVEFSGPDNT